MKRNRLSMRMVYDLSLMHPFSKALILGSGSSGKAAEALLCSENTEVLLLDERSCDFSSFKFQVSSFRPPVAVVSPGFSLNHPWMEELRRQGIPLLSELELGWSRFKGRTVAVTGSNGKSTVVKWIADALTLSGQPAVPCGNYGLPVSEAVMQPDPPEWLVIEVSSFQLETVQHFRPDIGVLLNVLPNHLDRHGDMETYLNLKLRLFENMTANGCAICPVDFFQTLEDFFPGPGKPTPAPPLRMAPARQVGPPSNGGDFICGPSHYDSSFSCSSGKVPVHAETHPGLRPPLPWRGILLQHSKLLVRYFAVQAASRFGFGCAAPGSFAVQTFGIEEGADFRFSDGKVGSVDLSSTYFDNEVLGAVAAAVAAVCEQAGVLRAVLERSARGFEPLPHRMQTVAELDGVRYIDDSKATNLAAMCAALRMTRGPVHLIAGGRAKEIDLSFAKDLLAQQVSRLYLIGEASGAMQSAWKDAVPCLFCGTLEKAVVEAREGAQPGGVVLLSPACTSFDQFCSFAERGDAFVRAVKEFAAG